MTLSLARAVQDWVELGLAPSGVSPHTLKNYRRSVLRLLADLGDRDVVALTPKDLARWQASIATSLAPTSVVQYHSAVNLFFKWLHEEGDIPSNPMTDVPWPKAPRVAKPRPLDEPILRALLRAVAAPRRGRSDFERIRDTALLAFIIETGCRAAEALTVTLVTLDLTLREARVVGKGGKVRTVRFGAYAARYMRRWLRERERHPLADTDVLWLGRRGPLGYQAVYDMVTKAARRAGVIGVHPHLFRHTFAHSRLTEGMQEGDVARLLGHASTKMVHDVYAAALAEERALEAYDRFRSPLSTRQGSYRISRDV